jgi:hypothetical protein
MASGSAHELRKGSKEGGGRGRLSGALVAFAPVRHEIDQGPRDAADSPLRKLKFGPVNAAAAVPPG